VVADFVQIDDGNVLQGSGVVAVHVPVDIEQ